jgi:hypothetical protein
MFIEKLMGKGKSCAPLGREIVENCDFLRPYRWLISCAPPAHEVCALFNQ